MTRWKFYKDNRGRKSKVMMNDLLKASFDLVKRKRFYKKNFTVKRGKMKSLFREVSFEDYMERMLTELEKGL